MREVDISISEAQTRYMQSLLQNSLSSVFRSVNAGKVKLTQDITTVEYGIIKECEKLCHLKERQALIP